MTGPALWVQPYISIVVAGNCGDPVRRSEMAQPLGGKHEFLGQSKIDEIPGHRDVVRSPLDEIAGQHVEDVPAVHEFPPAVPIDIAKYALAEEIPPPGAWHGAQMNVGKVSEGEQYRDRGLDVVSY